MKPARRMAPSSAWCEMDQLGGGAARGPVAFRKHTPGLTDRGVRGPPGGRLGRMMNQLSDAEKTIDGICGSVQCG